MADTKQSADVRGVALTELLACPFCGARMYWFSNRDWHRIRGEHDDDCIFDWEADALMVPATDGAKAEATAAWNRRANRC